MINYSGNYACILDASLNEGYSSDSFKFVVVSTVMHVATANSCWKGGCYSKVYVSGSEKGPLWPRLQF